MPTTSTLYWQIAGARSPVRLQGGRQHTFLVRLPDGAVPGNFGLFPLDTMKDAHQTRTEPGNKNIVLSLYINLRKVASSSYSLTPVQDLPPGEYSFSASGSNDAYCFGIDAPAAPQPQRGPVSL